MKTMHEVTRANGSTPARRSRALVLNVTEEPIAVVSGRRAVILVLGEKADAIAHNGAEVRSEHLSLRVPSVIRLRYFVRVPYRRTAPLHRRAVFARDSHRCQYCSAPAECIDHVMPRSRGGPHEWGNVVASCRHCNLRKGDRLLKDTPLRLARDPFAPRALSWIGLSVGSVPEQWEPYLPDISVPAR